VISAYTEGHIKKNRSVSKLYEKTEILLAFASNSSRKSKDLTLKFYVSCYIFESIGQSIIRQGRKIWNVILPLDTFRGKIKLVI